MQKTAESFYLLKYTLSQILGLSIDEVNQISEKEYLWVDVNGIEGKLIRNWNGSWNVLHDDKIQYPIESSLVDIVSISLKNPKQVLATYRNIKRVSTRDWKIRSKVIFFNLKSMLEQFIQSAPNPQELNDSIEIDNHQIFFTPHGKFITSLN